MDVNQLQYLSPADWVGGRGMLWPEQLLILVTQLRKPVNESNPEPVKETETAENTEKYVNSIKSVEISITTWAEEADEANKLEYSASD